MLWRFDQLGHTRWRGQAFATAAEASVVVLASSTAGGLPKDVEQWANDFVGQRLTTRTTLVALLGQDDAWTISIEGTVTSVPATAETRELNSAAPFAPPALATCAA